jgi:hypothetical protein
MCVFTRGRVCMYEHEIRPTQCVAECWLAFMHTRKCARTRTRSRAHTHARAHTCAQTRRSFDAVKLLCRPRSRNCVPRRCVSIIEMHLCHACYLPLTRARLCFFLACSLPLSRLLSARTYVCGRRSCTRRIIKLRHYCTRKIIKLRH